MFGSGWVFPFKRFVCIGTSCSSGTSSISDIAALPATVSPPFTNFEYFYWISLNWFEKSLGLKVEKSSDLYFETFFGEKLFYSCKVFFFLSEFSNTI